MFGAGPFGGGIAIDIDQDLPEFQMNYGNVRYWARSVYYDSYGRYRRTHALIHPGESERYAIFAATLPRSGRWHMGASARENAPLRRSLLGKYELELVPGDSK